MIFPCRPLLLGLVPLIASLSAHGDEADVINLRASTNILRDDNLFRVSDRAGQKPQMETITTTIAGVDVNKKVSLQQLVAHVNWVDTRYAANDYLNAGSLHYDGRWLWAVGSHLKGELGATRSTVQNSFTDFPGLRRRNLRTTEDQHFNVDYAVHPSWQLAGGVSHLTVTNDQLLPAESDVEISGANLGFRFVPASGNWVGFQSKRSEGRYTKRPFDQGSQFDNRFTQTGQELAASWQPTGHSTFTGRLEYAERRHPHFRSRDFSGWTGQLSYLYQYSVKTALTASYVRGINAFQDVASSYYTFDDLILAARWDATAKVTLSARTGYTQRRYLGEISPLTGPRREDDVVRVGADLTYKPTRWLELRTGAAVEQRHSTTNLLNYTDRQLQLAATLQF